MLLIATVSCSSRRSVSRRRTGHLAALIALTSGMAHVDVADDAAIMSAVRRGVPARVGDERPDARARRRARRRSARQYRGLAVQQPSPRCHRGAAPSARGPLHRRSPVRCTRPSSWAAGRRASSRWPRRPPSSTASTSPRCSALASRSSRRSSPPATCRDRRAQLPLGYEHALEERVVRIAAHREADAEQRGHVDAVDERGRRRREDLARRTRNSLRRGAPRRSDALRACDGSAELALVDGCCTARRRRCRAPRCRARRRARGSRRSSPSRRRPGGRAPPT